MSSITMDPEFTQTQEKIDELNMAYHKKIEEFAAQRDVKKNPIFAVRTAALRERGVSGKFWSTVIRAHPDIRESLMGPYDDEILNFLEDFHVEYLPQGGFHLKLSFRVNDFFRDKTLWAKVERQEGGVKDLITTSGVQWKEGQGPSSEQDESDASDSRAAGHKATRDSARVTRGRSMFECFHLMPVHPSFESGSEEEEESDEEVEERIASFEEMHEARMDVFHCFVEEIWEDPRAILQPEGSES